MQEITPNDSLRTHIYRRPRFDPVVHSAQAGARDVNRKTHTPSPATDFPLLLLLLLLLAQITQRDTS